jgi:hypothetical protein
VPQALALTGADLLMECILVLNSYALQGFLFLPLAVLLEIIEKKELADLDALLSKRRKDSADIGNRK